MIRKLTNYWVVVKGDFIFSNSVSPTRDLAKESFLQDGLNKSWIYWSKQGYRCIQVNINFEDVK